MNKNILGVLAASTCLSPLMAMAQTEVHFWHAFTGRLGELVAAQVDEFNASQNDYKVVQTHKGNYSETLNAGIAAFRANEQPHILMVFEVGTATMMAAKGAIKPVYEVMAESGASFDPDAYIGSVKGYYTTTDGKMLSLPFNSSTPVLWVNRDAMSAAGVRSGRGYVDLGTSWCCLRSIESRRRRLPAGYCLAKLDPPRKFLCLP